MLYACACCGKQTLSQPAGTGLYEICEICGWEDDPVQLADPDFIGGANSVSLNMARQNFKSLGKPKD